MIKTQQALGARSCLNSQITDVTHAVRYLTKGQQRTIMPLIKLSSSDRVSVCNQCALAGALHSVPGPFGVLGLLKVFSPAHYGRPGLVSASRS